MSETNINEEKEKLQKVINYKKDSLKALRKVLRDSSNIPEIYFKFRWDDYQKDHDQKKIINDISVQQSRESAKAICLQYALNISEVYTQGRSLLIIGRRSSGKTVLATLILRQSIAEIYESVYFTPFTQLAIEANTANLSEEREEFEEKYISPSFLLIDEMDDMDVTIKMKNYIGHVLIERQKLKRPTIVTSKISLKRIKTLYGNLVYSALTDNNYFLPEIVIETGDDGDLLSLSLQPGTLYNIKTLGEELKSFRSAQKIQKTNNKRMNDSLISAEDIIRILKMSMVNNE